MADVKKTAKTVSEQIKSETGRRLIIGALGLVTVLAVTILFTVIPYTITSDRLKEASFWTDFLMVVAIIILATIIMLYMSRSRNAASPISKISLASEAFKAAKGAVMKKGLSNFYRWIHEKLEEDDRKAIKQRILDEAGIMQPEILELSEPQLKVLLDHPSKFEQNGKVFLQISKEQYDTVMKLKTKGIKIKFVSVEYWITLKGGTGSKTRSERAIKEGSKKMWYFLLSLLGKIILTGLIFAIFALFTRDLVAEPASAAETSAKMASRLMAFCTSVFLGYMMGIALNDMDAVYIEMRTDAQLEFIQDKEFKCMTIDEEANAAYIEWVKKEQMKPMQIEQSAHLLEQKK